MQAWCILALQTRPRQSNDGRRTSRQRSLGQGLDLFLRMWTFGGASDSYATGSSRRSEGSVNRAQVPSLATQGKPSREAGPETSNHIGSAMRPGSASRALQSCSRFAVHNWGSYSYLSGRMLRLHVWGKLPYPDSHDLIRQA